MRTRRLCTRFSLVAVLVLLMILGKAPATLAKGMVHVQGPAIDDQSGTLFMTDSMYSVTEYDARTGVALRTFALSKKPLFPISVTVLPRIHADCRRGAAGT